MTERTDLEVLCGRVNKQLANVYFTWSGPPDARLSGFVEGPFTQFGHTLPARFELVDLGPGQSRLLHTKITDPCPWTPLHPTTYQLHLSVDNEPPRCCSFGVRTFGPRDKSFLLDTIRTVFRGVHDSVSEDAISTCRDLNCGIVLTVSPSSNVRALDQGLERASSQGIPLVVDLRDSTILLSEWLTRFSWHPCVLAVIPPTATPTEQLAEMTKANICLLQCIHSDAPDVAAWAKALWVEIPAGAAAPEWPTGLPQNIPSFAVRRASAGSLAARRAQCDRLQADLAPAGDFAGYVV